MSRDNEAFITLTGFRVAAFEYLLVLFAPLYDEHSHFADNDGFIVKKLSKYGRPFIICSEDCLGIVLAWIQTRQMQTRGLQIQFANDTVNDI